MSERFTKSAARNVFYGGSAFFLVAFVILTAHSHLYIRNSSTDKSGLTESVARGKRASRAESMSGRRMLASTAIRCLARAPILRPSSAMSGSDMAARTIRMQRARR